MRSPMRLRQKIWFAKVTEMIDGIDTVKTYNRPITKKMTVSMTSGTPEELAAGITPTYDRYITSFDRVFNERVSEGDVLWVDTVPQLDRNGYLVTIHDGIKLATPPDYIIKKIISTQKGKVIRYGISKLGGED